MHVWHMQLAVACAAGLALSVNDLQEWQPVLEVEVVTMTNSFAVEASTWIILLPLPQFLHQQRWYNP